MKTICHCCEILSLRKSLGVGCKGDFGGDASVMSLL